MGIDEILTESSQRKGYFPKAAIEQREASAGIVAIKSKYRLGDTVTEGLYRILASVYNGDLTPLQTLIENDNDDIDMFIRGAALRAIVTLYFTHQIDRDTVLQYFTRLYRSKLKRWESYVWGVLVDLTGQLGFRELLADVHLAYKHELVDSFYRKLSSVGKDLEQASDQPKSSDDARLITDAVAELNGWATFQPAPKPAKRPAPVPQKQHFHTDDTLARETPKTGRNDPCPCGSGKKYKKC